MKIPRHEFKKLQQHWYKKLKDSGFDDIENETFDLLNKPPPLLADIVKAAREEYFRLISWCVQDENTVFRNDVDRYILERHAEGANANTISKELSKRGTPRHRHSIRFIVRKYAFAWGVRCFTPTELNIKITK